MSLTTSAFSISCLLRMEAEVEGPDERADCASATREEILGWIADNYGAMLPQDAWDGAAFTADAARGGRIEVMCNETTWLARLGNLPSGFMLDTAVVQANGTTRVVTEISRLTEGPNTALISCVPSIIPRLAERLQLKRDGRILSGQAEKLRTNTNVRAFLALLDNPARRLPVIAVSEDSLTRKMMVDPNVLAAKLRGLAHVVAIPHELSRDLTDLAGKEWSVFRGAVRFYRTKLDRFSDSYRRHPLLMPQSGDTEAELLTTLLRLTAASSISKHAREGDIGQYYAHVTGADLSSRLLLAASDKARIKLLQNEVSSLSERIEAALTIMTNAATRPAHAADVSPHEEEILRHRLQAVEAVLRESGTLADTTCSAASTLMARMNQVTADSIHIPTPTTDATDALWLGKYKIDPPSAAASVPLPADAIASIAKQTASNTHTGHQLAEV